MSFDEAVKRKGLSFDKHGNLLTVNRIFVFTPKDNSVKNLVGIKLMGLVLGSSYMPSGILILYISTSNILEAFLMLTLRYVPRNSRDAKEGNVKGDDFYLVSEDLSSAGKMTYWEGDLKFI